MPHDLAIPIEREKKGSGTAIAWTSPPTYTTGQLITAAIANAQWRDNLNLIVTYLDTATGRWAGELKKWWTEITTCTIAANAIAVDLSLSNTFKVSLTANLSATPGITVTNWTASKSSTVTIRLTQDGTGGRTVNWPTGWKWDGGTVPTMTAAANKTDVVVLYSDDGGTTIFASRFVVNA